MLNYDILIKPVATEKSMMDIANKKYTFKVQKKATKPQIRAAVESIFGVKVKSVNTVTVHGKLKRMGRTEGYTSSYKKAIVQLTEDSKSIEYFDSLQ